jgi:glucose dehydrogenase
MAHNWRRLAQHALFDAHADQHQQRQEPEGRLGDTFGLRPRSEVSFEGTPIVKDGVLYIATGNDDVFALDGRTGALLWEHRSGLEQNISTVCCGWDNRGAAVGDGKLFLGQLDGTFVALDIGTGKEVWRTRLARWQAFDYPQFEPR